MTVGQNGPMVTDRSPERNDSPTKRGRGRPALGRSTPLERDEVLARALEIVRADGVEGLNMRRLASELGVTPMSIYHYVPNKPALLDAIIQQLWNSVLDGVGESHGDIKEWMIQVNLRTRNVWIENLGLANLAMAVAEPDETFFDVTLLSVRITQAIGFPDPELAYSAIQNYTMGSIAVAANRRYASRYFGRDPVEILGRAHALLDDREASPEHHGIVTARFDEGDDEHFERGLRALVAGLLAGPE